MIVLYLEHIYQLGTDNLSVDWVLITCELAYSPINASEATFKET